MWQHILFDLDGTLTDPAEGITGSVRYAMQKMGYPVPEQAVLERFIGPPLDEIFFEVCGYGAEQSAQAILYFREYFSSTGINQNEIFPGMADLLQELVDAGRTLHVATTKPLHFANVVLDNFDIAQYFGTVAGSGLAHAGRPKAEVVQEVLDTAGIDPAQAVMIGDRKHDVVGAHAYGLPCIGVTFGYGGRDELAQAGAEYIVDDMAGLRAVLLAR